MTGSSVMKEVTVKKNRYDLSSNSRLLIEGDAGWYRRVNFAGKPLHSVHLTLWKGLCQAFSSDQLHLCILL